MDSPILTIKEKLILIDSIEKNRISNNKIKKIIENLSSNKKIIDEKIEKWTKDIQINYIKNMKKKLPIIKAKITRIKLKTKETISKQKQIEPEKLLELI